MRSFVLTSLLTIGFICTACSTPGVDGDPYGGSYESTDPPARATPKKDAGAADNPVTPPAAVVTNVTLTIALTGVGSITSTPAGVTCTGGTGCTGTFPRGAAVTLSQTSANGTLFGGWGGGCTGATCSLTMDAAKSVSATFVNVEGTWMGTYTNTRTANGCTFNNAGNVKMVNVSSNGSLVTSSNVDGLEIRQLPGCGLVGKVNGASNNEPLAFTPTDFTGTWTMNVSSGGQLPFPFKAKLDGDKLTGTWTCTGCAGGFSITKSP